MPSQEEILAQKERLYESSSLRDDLNDAEATILLKWGESQVDRLAEAFPGEFEQKARFMRQVIKGINRFVGQREFNDFEGQAKYMNDFLMYLEPLGWSGINAGNLFAVLPEDKADMSANLEAILSALSPEEISEDLPESDPILDDSLPGNDGQQLENINPHSITQAEETESLGVELDYDEEE